MTDRFRLMLHDISAKLSEKDLTNLISLCDVCESRRADIKGGMSLFEHLMHRDIISNKKVNELKNLLKSLRPKRRDLVNLVNDYMAMGGLPRTEEDDCSEIVAIGHSTSNHEEVDHTPPCCSVHWSCLNASFYKVHSVYVVLFLVFVIAIVICCVLWYGNVPRITKHLHADEDTKNAGGYVIFAIMICFPVSLLCVFRCRKYHQGNTKTLENLPEANESVAIEMETNSGTISQDNTVNVCRGNSNAGVDGISLDSGSDKEPIIHNQRESET